MPQTWLSVVLVEPLVRDGPQLQLSPSDVRHEAAPMPLACRGIRTITTPRHRAITNEPQQVDSTITRSRILRRPGRQQRTEDWRCGARCVGRRAQRPASQRTTPRWRRTTPRRRGTRRVGKTAERSWAATSPTTCSRPPSQVLQSSPATSRGVAERDGAINEAAAWAAEAADTEMPTASLLAAAPATRAFEADAFERDEHGCMPRRSPHAGARRGAACGGPRPGRGSPPPSRRSAPSTTACSS